jgi:ComF family protein
VHLNHSEFVIYFKKAGVFTLDLLFPLRCLGCRRTGAWICTTCFDHIPRRLEQRCPTCLRRITPAGQLCFQCRDTTSSALDGLFVASYYQNSLLPHAIHTFKYRFIPDLALPLGTLLAKTLEHSTVLLPDAIIPVPLHRRRLRFRGFNQSELLARTLAQTLTPELEYPVLIDVLLRTRHTKPQMKTSTRAERLTNLKDAFALGEDKQTTIAGKSLWLIDDVATTGTTLTECATILKRHGATSVFGIVLAR